MSSKGRKYRYHPTKQDMDWQEEQADRGGPKRNVGEIERAISATVGTGLLAMGLRRRSWSGALMAMVGGGLVYRAASGHCALYQAMGIDTSRSWETTNRLGRRKVSSDRATKIQQSIEVDRPPNELYRFWRRLDNLPRVMSHLQSVERINDRLSHWMVKTMPGMPAVEWDAEIINEVENERIGWRSLNDADVDHAGSVEFEPLPGGQKTRVTVMLQYAPAGGKIGSAIANLFGQDAGRKIAQDLQRFKEQMEAGAYQT